MTLPAAALAQLASRNSALVATRSCARARTRSGSQSSTCAPSGSTSVSSCMPSTSAGVSDSMPSTAMPSATFSSRSVTPGSCGASSRARARTSSVSSSSRHGGAHRPCWATSRLRWSATANQRISSTVSPQNSTRSGCSSVGGKTSRMPPRTAKSPRRSTRSVRVYAAAARRRATSSSSASSPAASCTGSRSPRPFTIGWSTARTGATTTLTRPVVSSVGVRVGQPAQHGEATADGVAARAEPLVRQRLPRREVDDRRPAAGSSAAAPRGPRPHAWWR